MGKEGRRMRDMPRSKRCAHFWRYYKLHVLAGIAVAVLLGNMAYASLLKPRADVHLLWLSGQYSLSCENALLEKLEAMPDWDLNGDGRTCVRLHHIDFSVPSSELGLPVQAELLTVYSAGESSIYLLSSHAMEWMKQNGLLGRWQDIGLDGEGIFSLRAGEIPFFQEEAMSPLADAMLCAARPDQQAGTTYYAAQIGALRSLLEWKSGLG